MKQKQTFKTLFLILVLVLMLMPPFTTFNDLLTRLVMKLDLYRLIQNKIVPWEIRMVGAILLPFGFKPAVYGEYLSINSSQNPLVVSQSNPFLIEITWNCLGWQSLLFFLITAWVGLQGEKYTFVSKIKALVIGFLGTFLINLFRITIVTLFAYYFGQKVAILFHDYGSTILILIWLFFFWWFSYCFVLETRD